MEERTNRVRFCVDNEKAGQERREWEWLFLEGSPCSCLRQSPYAAKIRKILATEIETFSPTHKHTNPSEILKNFTSSPTNPIDYRLGAPVAT